MAPKKNADRLALARAVKAAKRHLAHRTITIELSRDDARWLLERVDGKGDESAARIRSQLVAQAF
jgi:hypothetical protein